MDVWNRHSAIISKNAAISCDQAQATSIGLDILKMGGNAADAAVATFAAVSVIQPMSCGIGGDCQCLFYRHSDKTVLSLNGSGRTGKNATLEKVKALGVLDSNEKDFSHHGLWVSVPGAVAGMCDVIKHFGSGKLTMSQILDPAIALAQEGAPVPYKTAIMWDRYQEVFRGSRHAKDILQGDKPPLPGSLIVAPKLANCYKSFAAFGPKEFYEGNIASNVVNEVQHSGGVLTLGDMKKHLDISSSTPPSDAVWINFNGFRIWEMKPNTTGIVALVALNVLKLFDLKGLGHNSAEYIHIIAEVTKLSYLECWDYLCDPDYTTKCLKTLLSDDTAKKIKNCISTQRGSGYSKILTGGNTSYVAVVDEEGNGCSFIYSVSSNFGTGIIPKDCGFVLHDRAKCLSLDERSANVYGPEKLPLHTIIPGLVTDDATNDLIAVFGVIGRWMQPQGHVQVLLNMIIFGMDPQNALNQPRFFVGESKTLLTYKNTLNMLYLEEGINPSVVPVLQNYGHEVCGEFYSGPKREIFGKGHVIARPVLW
ncbi:putative gamma-glutamyltransferase ywrD, partial [Stegodyphus mimosarum]